MFESATVDSLPISEIAQLLLLVHVDCYCCSTDRLYYSFVIVSLHTHQQGALWCKVLGALFSQSLVMIEYVIF